MEKTKVCKKCGYELLLEDFYVLGGDPKRAQSWCKSCVITYAQKSRKKIWNKRIEKGLCRECGKPTLIHSKRFCEFHYIASMIRNAIGHGSKEVALRLYDKLYSQNFTCPYTGEKLVLGVNAWIDHILPRSRFPGQETSLDNLQWVSKKANKAKHNLTKNEFISFCKLIASRF